MARNESFRHTQRLVQITQRWLNEFNNFAKHYDEIEQGYKYLAGDQYDASQLEWYESVRRPARVFNLIFPQFNQVLGDFLLNDQKIHCYARPGGDSKIASMFEDLLDGSNIDNDHQSVLGEYALSGIIKMGFLYPRFSDEKEIDGSLVMGRVDEFEVLFDTAALDYFLDDAKYLARSKWLDRDQILNDFPAHRSELKGLLIDRFDSDFWENVNPDDSLVLNHHHVLHQAEGKYRIIEWHEMRYKDVDVAVDTLTGQSQIWTLHGKKADLFRRLNPNTKITRRRDRIKTITTIIPALNYMIGEKDADIQDRSFDIVPFSAYNFGGKSFRNFGLFKNAIGPQDDFNSWLNQSNALINKTVNPGHKYKPDALKNPKQVELYGSAPGVDYQIKDTHSLEDIQENPAPRYPFASERLGGERGDLLQKITGITQNLTGGQETSQENASLFAQRVKRAQVGLKGMYNNFSRSKRRVYNKKIRLIQENYTVQKFFLVTSPDRKQQENLLTKYEIQSINDIKTGRYNIVADDQDRNPTAKYMRFLQKTEVVQTVLTMFSNVPMPPQAIGFILDWWLKESDLGDIDEFVGAFTQAINQQMAQQSEQGQKQDAFQDAQQLVQLASQKQSMEGGLGKESPANQRQ